MKTEAALEKAKEAMSPAQQRVVDKLESRARRSALEMVREKMPQISDVAVNAGERLGGGLLGWAFDLGTRALVDKLAQPAADGTTNTFAKHTDYWKGGISLAAGVVGLAANYAMPSSVEASMVRRVAANASAAHLLFGADRLLTRALKLPQ